MNIKLLKSTAEEIGLARFNRFLGEHSWSWRDEAYIDLSNFNPNEIAGLRSLLLEHVEKLGVKPMLNDVDTWLDVLRAEGNIFKAKARSPRQLEPILIRLIGRTPGHRLYTRHSELNDIWLCYYTEKLEYHPRQEDRGYVTPEHLTMELYYEDWNGLQREQITFWPDDCRGIPAGEVLARKGLFPETDDLRKKYLREVKRYKELTEKIGKQCLAYGTATDKDVDGNFKRDSWYSSRGNKYDMGGRKVLIDVFKEQQKEKDRYDRPHHVDMYFWTIKSHIKLIVQRGNKHRMRLDDEEQLLEDLDVPNPVVEIPIHPFCIVFDLLRHLRLSIHVSLLADYKFKKDIIDRLIIPGGLKILVTMLIEHRTGEFKDIVEGKGGGAVVLLCGQPGVGKTLTAEVYAENEEKGLYSVQCSQLGLTPSELEDNLLRVFTRAKRWDAVLLLDEADVYVRQRGSNLNQNAIVGVFLRVLEYQDAILFLTTNRPKDVDDAVASRCIARINYPVPSPEDQAKIWRVLADMSDIKLPDDVIHKIVEHSPGISGRDVKNLLKLANLWAKNEGNDINWQIIEHVKQFKPTL